jgi:hypothetical protein
MPSRRVPFVLLTAAGHESAVHDRLKHFSLCGDHAFLAVANRVPQMAIENDQLNLGNVA